MLEVIAGPRKRMESSREWVIDDGKENRKLGTSLLWPRRSAPTPKLFIALLKKPHNYTSRRALHPIKLQTTQGPKLRPFVGRATYLQSVEVGSTNARAPEWIGVRFRAREPRKSSGDSSGDALFSRWEVSEGGHLSRGADPRPGTQNTDLYSGFFNEPLILSE